jgi:hypothetical protein
MPNSSVQRLVEKLELTRRQLVNELILLDDRVLHFRPANHKWSILQIIFHLNHSEKASIQYIFKKSQGGASVPKATWVSFFRSKLLAVALRHFTWKKPSILPDPPEQINTAEMLKEWGETRLLMQEVLRQLPLDMQRRQIYRHPIAGRMNVSQALSFMQDHFDHHLRQIRERISAAPFKR